MKYSVESITKKEHPTGNTTKEDRLDWSRVAYKYLLIKLLKERQVTERRGRRSRPLLDYLKKKIRYLILKEDALACIMLKKVLSQDRIRSGLFVNAVTHL